MKEKKSDSALHLEKITNFWPKHPALVFTV